MQKLSLMVVVAIVVAACSPALESASPVTEPVDGSTSTTVAASTTTQVVTSTQAPLTGAPCVVGSWELDSELFFTDVTSVVSGGEAPGEFLYLGGAYRISLDGDGSANEQREDWTFLVRTDFGDLVIAVNALAQGEYMVDGETMSLELDQSSSEVEVLIDGLPIEFPDGSLPVSIPDVSFVNAPFTCSQDTLITTADGVTSTWRRGT